MPPTNNPLRFGIALGNWPYDRTVAIAQVAEESGFDVAAINDRPTENNLEAWTLASALGALTTKITVTHRTLNVPFRNPGLTAKMAATLDVITGGRLELTLGAGGQEPHYLAYGIPYGSGGERLAGLQDAVAIMRGMWGAEPFSYEGGHYKVENVSASPKPVHGSIPIVIGAGGPRLMHYTGAVADGWMKNRGWPLSMDELRELVAMLEEGAEQAGRDPADVRRVLNGAGVIGADAMARHAASPMADPNAYLTRDGLMGNSGDEILEVIHKFRGQGIDSFYLRFLEEGTEEQIRRFGAEVIAKVKR
jgi:alkanesulfonate monooxygenase SsuD/methylene tetrahydromethanopterin reductase-like flavin-dependent oxidoreductase (luciferase family)